MPGLMMLGQWFLAAILTSVLPYTMTGNASLTFPLIVIMLLSLLIPMYFAMTMKTGITKTEGIAVTIISIPFVIVIILLVVFLHPIGRF